ncbi:phosphoadenylyl-sulfate reductase [Puniceibacterium sp. IMCC21224]|uniref:phosphoadenylyl-sulfate reductase n=1 Tax=Puniceibacterium sp. IMCC21224 TaxID=1618204 RepID=UPI00064DC456|nr:phosphoadenylyl-sulfate reductase [Puniceibacterium sp. IMCC21224]KMK63950.1 phosphoadenylylsulfate reductase (thioredoxin) [Puniceibacterium sp. IMCC21224]
MAAFETSARLELQDRAHGLSNRYEGQSAQEVLESAIRQDFAGKIGLVSSFGAESAVLLHMVAMIDPYVPVIFLDTWKHFPETIEYRDTLVAKLGLCNIQVVTPRPAGVAADDPDGDLSKTNPDLCCHVRKTLPMLAALRSLSCWITGRKRGQTADRDDLALFEAQDRWLKVNPLLDWGRDDIASYFKAHDLPEHPLKAQGYLSIGCAPCTRAVRPDEDPRAGRWADSEKSECGIHIVDGKIVRQGA